MSLNFEELQKLLAAKREEVSQQGNGELGKVEKLANEFFEMKVPHGSEILDVACGSGILSCILQGRGYCNIDALDEDLDVINDLKSRNLYRNYISRGVKGIRSTGIESNMYDVVITAGGFAKDAINPLDITELIRILRPEGILLWTMNAAQDERSSEFGLLLANLKSLEIAGRISIVKHQQFINYDDQDDTGDSQSKEGTKYGGEFYLIKRLAGPLCYFAESEVSNQLKTKIADLIHETDSQTRIQFYDEWSDKYEEDLVKVGNYSGHIKCVEAFLSLDLKRSVSILDLACGTGLLGAELTRFGYVNMDGLDASLQMLGQAKKKNLFKEYVYAAVNGNGSLPLHDDMYDVVLSSNGFAPGQIYPESIEEILRILKWGGCLILTMRDGLAEKSPRFANFDHDLRELEKRGKCEVTMGPIKFANFILDHPGIFYMIRKTPHSQLAFADSQP